MEKITDFDVNLLFAAGKEGPLPIAKITFRYANVKNQKEKHICFTAIMSQMSILNKMINHAVKQMEKYMTKMYRQNYSSE